MTFLLEIHWEEYSNAGDLVAYLYNCSEPLVDLCSYYLNKYKYHLNVDQLFSMNCWGLHILSHCILFRKSIKYSLNTLSIVNIYLHSIYANNSITTMC